MPDVLSLASANLTSPMVLFFALGLIAALARARLDFPESVGKVLALYLMMAIGFKGGASVAAHPLDGQVVAKLVAGAALSFAIPLIAFRLLQVATRLPAIDAAALAGHYGSISIVTFVAATEALSALGIGYDGTMVAVAAVMEAPALLTALWLANGGARQTTETGGGPSILGEIVGNASIVILTGAFVIGWITGARGLEMVAPFVVDPFNGVLCLFLLEMGLVAGRGMIDAWRHLDVRIIAFGCYMPLISAALAAVVAGTLGLGLGSAALLITLAASASYIAAPAAMRLALPEARPAVYLTMSLGVTFPFNLTVGIPLYLAIAGMLP